MIEYLPFEEMEIHNVIVYFCKPCKAEYIFFNDGMLAAVSLYTTIKNKMYRWSVISENNAQLWYVKFPGIPGFKANDGMSTVLSFNNKIPLLNPLNINQKVTTWLLFL